ncbi:hypothetical protein THRCLA_23440, partial [Thraustotheca clavata]
MELYALVSISARQTPVYLLLYKCIVIDSSALGVGYWKLFANHVKIVNHVHNDVKHKTLPSLVGFPSTGNPIVGFDAIEQENTKDVLPIRCVKRLMGKTYQECVKDQKYLSYQLCEDNGNAAIDFPAKNTKILAEE